MTFEIEGLDRLDNLLTRLKNYRSDLDSKKHELIKRLAEIGIDTADIHFREAQYDGENDVSMDTPRFTSNNRVVISARGRTVLFIEFGSGIHYQEQHPLADDLGMIRGEYGYGRGKNDTWTYIGDSPGTNGEVIKQTERGFVYKTHGNPPAKAMYNATEAIQAQIIDIASEVFKFD